MWFDDFPEQCPPSDARQDELEVFRLVSNNPPISDDFLPTRRERPHQKFSGVELCNACGVSVFKEINDLLKKQEKYKKLKGKKIAKGIITKNDGLVKETGEPSHMTWWLQTSEPHKTFSEVKNVTK